MLSVCIFAYLFTCLLNVCKRLPAVGAYPHPVSPATAQLLTDQSQEGSSAALPEGGRPATESLLHTQRIAEGLFDVSRAAVGRAGGSGNVGGTGTTSAFDTYSASLPKTTDRRLDAFNVSWFEY